MKPDLQGFSRVERPRGSDYQKRRAGTIRRLCVKTLSTRLLFAWSEVALLCARNVPSIVTEKIDSAERPVIFEVGGGVGKGVLAPEFFLNIVKTSRHFFD